MTVTINTTTSGIDVIAGGAVPTIDFVKGMGGPVAVVNLTKNFNPNPKLAGWAFELMGHVKVALAPGDTLDRHTFGFVQYIRHNFTGFFYAGRRSREGSIGMLLHPLITDAYFLDCAPVTVRPFMWPPGKNSMFFSGEQTTKMGDHPVLSIKQRQLNLASGVENFLFQIVDDREVWSIFTVLDPSGKFQHLAHVRWTIRYDVKIKWRKGSPSIAENKSKFSVGSSVQGAPRDAKLQSVLSALSATQSPIANDHVKQGLRRVLVPPNSNRSDNAEWFNNIPADFYL